MKYKNARDILPPELISQIQKYAAGKLLYIPKEDDSTPWGTLSGAKLALKKRNQRIYNEYKEGKGINELAEEFFISVDSIKKIVYGNKENKDSIIPFSQTLENAILYNEAGLDEEWIRTFFYKNLGENSFPEHWILDGLVKFPIRLFSQEKLQNLENSIKNVETKPFQKQKNEKTQIPLIFLFEDGTFYLLDVLDNKKLLAELKLKKTNAFPAYIFIKNKEEYPSYLKNYGNPFHQAKIN
ncbi:MAG: CD3324 family protein [Treponema sp.]|nr:CD3324 family protein [Spirochaetales bacterium]MDY6191027.1 CD3324 family protein [Treponema sp.]